VLADNGKGGLSQENLAVNLDVRIAPEVLIPPVAIPRNRLVHALASSGLTSRQDA